MDVVWRCPFFSDLGPVEKSELLSVSSYRHLRGGEPLYRQGDPLQNFYWVCSGAVQVYRVTPSGHELTASIAIIGDALYDKDILQQNSAHAFNTRSLQETTLFKVPVVWLRERMNNNWNHLSLHFVRYFAARAEEARIETEQQATFNAAQMIACFLQRICIRHRFDPRGFTLPYAKNVIASRLGMELESLSRALPKLRETGVAVKGSHVSFTDIPAVQDFCCASCSAVGDCAASKAMRELAPGAKPTLT